MIIDKLENIGMYVSVNPLFAQTIEFLRSTDLNAHELGKVVLKKANCSLTLLLQDQKLRMTQKSRHTITSLISRFLLQVLNLWDICQELTLLRLNTMLKRM